jgi:hypothetical protein
MKFFFWADTESGKLSPMMESAASNDISPEPIGMGQMVPDWHHSLFKQRALYEAIKELDDAEIVCATDGFDVFFQQNAEYIEKQFLSFDRDVVFSAERGYTHQYRSFKPFFDRAAGSSPYKYLNAGGVVGYAGALKRLYRPGALLRLKITLVRLAFVRKLLVVFTQALCGMRSSRETNGQDSIIYLKCFDYTDQALMGKHLASGSDQVSIELDRSCKLFWCTAFEWEDIDSHYELVDGKLENRHTGHRPACIHVPWNSRYRAVFLKLYELVHGSNRPSES